MDLLLENARLGAELHTAKQRLAELDQAFGIHGPLSYNSDALAVWNKSVDFMQDKRFLRAYRRGMDSGHVIGRPPGSSLNVHI